MSDDRMTAHDRANLAVARASKALIVAGALVATLGVAVWVGGVGSQVPDWIMRVVAALPRLPDWLIAAAVYKAMFLSAAGLLIAGSVIRRYALKDVTGGQARLAGGGAPDALAEPSDAPLAVPQASRLNVGSTKQKEVHEHGPESRT